MKIKAELNNLDNPKHNVRYNLEKARLLIRRCMPHSSGLVHVYLGNVSEQIDSLLKATEYYGITS